MTTKTHAKRGPKEIFDAAKRQALIAGLTAVRDENGEQTPSRFLLKRMEDQGLIAFEIVKTGGRGRPAHKPVLTDEGAAVIAEG